MKGQRQLVKPVLFFILAFSLLIKLFVILKYGNRLTLGSDDINYIKSAVYLLKSGIFAFHNYDEPTVFVMPFYPFFLAGIFSIFGWGYNGMIAFRIIQAIISCVTIYFTYLLGKKFFNVRTGIAAAAMTAFYFPSMVTTGYALTETVFTALLVLLVYLSVQYSEQPSILKFTVLGVIWSMAVLCRPTIGLYPLFLFAYIYIRHKPDLLKLLKMGIPMVLVFLLAFTPWWIRNYREYGEFIPLAASSGNPLLQGTYVEYKQTSENVVYYKLGKNALETDTAEVKVARERMAGEFKKDFWGYLGWYTVGKTKLFWNTVFYWKEYLGISHEFVMVQHYLILLGFAGIVYLAKRGFTAYILPVSIIVYFNLVHCYYMAFDRYAYPLLPLLCVFSAYFINRVYLFVKNPVVPALNSR